MRALLHCRPFRRLFVQSGSLRLWNLLTGLTARSSQPSNEPMPVENCSIFETFRFFRLISTQRVVQLTQMDSIYSDILTKLKNLKQR